MYLTFIIPNSIFLSEGVATSSPDRICTVPVDVEGSDGANSIRDGLAFEYTVQVATLCSVSGLIELLEEGVALANDEEGTTPFNEAMMKQSSNDTKLRAWLKQANPELEVFVVTASGENDWID